MRTFRVNCKKLLNYNLNIIAPDHPTNTLTFLALYSDLIPGASLDDFIVDTSEYLHAIREVAMGYSYSTFKNLSIVIT